MHFYFHCDFIWLSFLFNLNKVIHYCIVVWPLVQWQYVIELWRWLNVYGQQLALLYGKKRLWNTNEGWPENRDFTSSSSWWIYAVHWPMSRGCNRSNELPITFVWRMGKWISCQHTNTDAWWNHWHWIVCCPCSHEGHGSYTVNIIIYSWFFLVLQFLHQLWIFQVQLRHQWCCFGVAYQVGRRSRCSTRYRWFHRVPLQSFPWKARIWNVF